MAVAIVKKAFKDLEIRSSITNVSLRLDKLELKVFNWLYYNRKVFRPLVAGFLLSLLDHYFLIAVVKIVNIALLKTRFKLILESQEFNQSSNIVYIDYRKMALCLMYEYYTYCNLAF